MAAKISNRSEQVGSRESGVLSRESGVGSREIRSEFCLTPDS